MHELTGRIENVSFDYFSGKPRVTFSMNEPGTAREMVDELKSQEKLTIKIGKFKKRRSLDCNAYAWVLIGKIAEKTNVRREEVYRAAIKEIGGNSETVCIQSKAVKTLCAAWEKNGIGWQVDTFPSKIEGCTNVILYYGSSCYDQEQMSRLISLIQQDCVALGIEVKSQAEIDSLLSSWGGD